MDQRDLERQHGVVPRGVAAGLGGLLELLPRHLGDEPLRSANRYPFRNLARYAFGYPSGHVD